MSDIQRTRSQILALLADNTSGQISAQDLRDFVVTVMELEFANAGDFWSRPQPKYITTDKTCKGWKLYSQVFGSACSFMNVMHMEASTGYWMQANAGLSTKNGLLGIAVSDYASDASGEILLEGIIYHSAFSAYFSAMNQPIYLGSTGSVGSINFSYAALTYDKLLGYTMQSDVFGASQIGKWYFKPDWTITGV